VNGWRGLLAGIATAAGALGIIALATWLALSYQYRQLAQTIEDSLRAQALDEAALVAALAENDPRGGESLFASLTSLPHRRLTVIAGDGHVLYDSEADPARMVNHNDRPEVIAARADGQGSAMRRSDTLGTPFIYAAKRLPDGRVVRVAAPFSVETTLVRTLFSSIAAASVVVVAAASGLLIANHWRSAARFRELQAVSQAFARGEFTRRAAIAGRGAYGRIGLELNHLGERLQETLAQLADQRRLLDRALDALAEGVACIDRLDRVVYANPAYRQLAAGGAEVTGQLFYEHIPAAAIAGPLALARSAEAQGGSQAAEFEHRRRQLRAVAVPAAGGVTVLVLHDLTESRRIEQARRDFMAAVSHEFKTPLTSIVGFTDTLLDGGLEDGEAARGFVEGIARHADRLSNLVRDVLTLARLEQGAWNVRPEPLDLHPLVESLLEEFQPTAEAKGVKLVLQSPGAQPMVGDPELLRQLIGNLLSNAIRYNRDNGTVWLRLESRGDRVAVTVQDTGHGIPPEHQERVFERFYRIDAHRSRQTGGTGLGLAIVKQLLEILGGSIAMRSDANGTRFEIELETGEKKPGG
jgi:two-component system phosphate regulon sensor histidine kinase PhoR